MSSVIPIKRLSGAVYLVSMAHLALEFSQNFMPVIYPLIIESMGVTYSQVGTVALTASLAASLMQPLFGLLSDRWDPRLIIVLSIAGSAMVMGTVGIVGFHTSHYLLLLPIVGMGGLSSAAFHPAGASMATAGVTRNRGLALSIFSVGGNLGSAISPVVVGVGLTWIGLRGTTILIPIGLALSVILFRTLRDAPRPARVSRSNDASRLESSAKRAGSWFAIALIVLIVASRSWFQGSLITYMPEWLQSQGRSLESASSILSAMLVTTSLGSLTGGTLSDRVGRVPIVMASFILLGPALWLFLHSVGLVQAIIVGILGFLIGSTFPVTIVLAQEALPTTVGLASSLVLGLGWLPSGIGAWFIGVLADRTTLTSALSSLSLVPLIGLSAGLILGWRKLSR